MTTSFFQRELWGLPYSNYFWCIGIILGTLLLEKYIAILLARLSHRVTGRYGRPQQHRLHHLIQGPLERLLQVVLYYIALYQVYPLLNKFSIRTTLGKTAGRIDLGNIINHISLLLFIIFLGQLMSRILDYIYYVKVDNAHEEENLSRLQLLPLIRDMAKLLLWTICIFWILGSVFAVNIPALITGLGIGGVAIALAGKETVENLFAAFTILSDKPFVTGETIRLGDFEGRVERIGFRSTRLRNAEGAVYVIPNKSLVEEKLTNLTQRNTQGIKLIVDVKHGVPYEQLQQMMAALKQMVQETQLVKDPVNVTLEAYGEKVFQVQVAYHLPNPMPNDVKDIDVKQQINLKVYDIVSKYTSGSGVEVHAES